MEITIGGKTRFENLLKQLFHSPLLDMKWLFYHFISNSGSWNDCYIFSFHLAKRIHESDPAETERCDIVGFSKVTTKSLASEVALRSQMK